MLCQHYENQGILVMVLLKLREADYHAPARAPALAAILDILRPEFHGPSLAFYSKITATVEAGYKPAAEMIMDLER